MKILKNTVKPFLLGLGLALAILLVIVTKWLLNDSSSSGSPMNHNKNIEIIRTYFPFQYSEQINPQFVYTVGEQVQVEHLFAFHARTALKSGFSGVMSDVSFNEQQNLVTIDLKHDCVRSDGHIMPFQTICEGLSASLQGTRHAPYASILKDLKCDEDRKRIQILFSKIPLNLRFLFTIPDLSIFDPAQLPLSLKNKNTASGPYFLKSLSPSFMKLRLNPHYPASLRANDVKNVEFHSYFPPETQQFVQNMDPKHHHMAYLYGHALEPSDVEHLRVRGYTVETFPTEWFVYLTIKKPVNAQLRKAVMAAINLYKTNEIVKSSLGLPAYSISPGDREFALNENEYKEVIGALKVDFDRNSQFTLSTLNSWSGIPFYKKIIAFLKIQFPNMEVQIIDRQEVERLFSKDVDIALALLGISPTDPLTHFSFLESVLYGFSEVVSKEKIADLSMISEPSEFNRSIKEIETKAAKDGLIVPIAHFPGIVAYRKDFIRDESKAFGWGIQTWTFRID